MRLGPLAFSLVALMEMDVEKVKAWTEANNAVQRDLLKVPMWRRSRLNSKV